MNVIISPFTNKRENELKNFLMSKGLRFDQRIEKMVCFLDKNDRIIACGGLDHSILKDILVDDNHQQEGLASALISYLSLLASEKGETHLMLFTKPENKLVFSALGFTVIEENEDVLFMENIPNGIKHYLDALPKYSGNNGCIIMNANPITLGHLQLISYAASKCDHLYVFVVEEDRSIFSFEQRIALVTQSVKDISNVSIHSTSKYLISSATFPDYFLKDKINSHNIHADLDLAIFLHHFVPTLNLSLRFVGSEPFDKITNTYNQLMRTRFFNEPVKLIEIPRFTLNQNIISASFVRKLIQEGKLHEASAYTPAPVSEMILSMRKGENNA